MTEEKHNLRKDLTDKELELLSKHHEGRVLNKSAIPSGDEHIKAWKEAGKPHLYEVVQETPEYVAVADFGYGHMALFKDEAIVATTSGKIIVTPEVAMIDPYHYGDAVTKVGSKPTPWLYFSKSNS